MLTEITEGSGVQAPAYRPESRPSQSETTSVSSK